MQGGVESRASCLQSSQLISLFNRTGWTFVKSYGSLKLEQPAIDSLYLIVVGKATSVKLKNEAFTKEELALTFAL